MARVAAEVYLPMVTNPRNRDVWSEMVMKDVVEGANGFVANIQIMEGQVLGATRLPLPPDSAILEVQEPNLSFEDRVFRDTDGARSGRESSRGLGPSAAVAPGRGGGVDRAPSFNAPPV